MFDNGQEDIEDVERESPEVVCMSAYVHGLEINGGTDRAATTDAACP